MSYTKAEGNQHINVINGITVIGVTGRKDNVIDVIIPYHVFYESEGGAKLQDRNKAMKIARKYAKVPTAYPTKQYMESSICLSIPYKGDADKAIKSLINNISKGNK